ncbi:MAG: hypothetical protein ACI81R_000472 [Bradymonadia bacterium]|jgi:hypothetical protein
MKTTPRLLALLLSSTLAACGGDDGESSSPEDDAGTDAGSGDGGTVGDGGVDGDDSGADAISVDDSLRLVFRREFTVPQDLETDYTQLMVASPQCIAPALDVCERGSCPIVEIAPRYPEEPLCENGCQVTTNMDFIVFADPNNARTLRWAPLDAGFQLAADSEVLADDIQDYQVAGTFIAYRVGNTVSLYDLQTGDDREVTRLPNSSGGFYLTTDGTQLFVNSVTLTKMEMEVYPTNGDPGLIVYDFISGEEQGTGSYFSGKEPMALSPDGSRLAVITSQRNSYNPCGSNADCTGAGQTCLQSAAPPRCVAEENTLHVIALDQGDVARLNTLCSIDADCGADQFCDLTAPDGNGEGRCLPSRFILGPNGTDACDFYQEGQYTDSRPELAWRDENAIIALLTQECVTGDIPVTDVVVFGLTGAAFTGIEVNPGEDHGQCYNDVEQCYDADTCRIEVSNIAVSPDGLLVAMVGDSFRTSGKNELWLTDANVPGGKRLLTTSIEYEVLGVTFHQVLE